MYDKFIDGYGGINMEELKGKTFSHIDREDDEALIFRTTEGEVYQMYHEQD